MRANTLTADFGRNDYCQLLDLPARDLAVSKSTSRNRIINDLRPQATVSYDVVDGSQTLGVARKIRQIPNGHVRIGDLGTHPFFQPAQTWTECSPIRWKARIPPQTEADVAKRFADLKAIALDESIAWNADAEAQVWAFLRRLHKPTAPAIGIDDNGDLRILWHNQRREQIGVRFDGAIDAEAVLFRATPTGMLRETLRGSPSAVLSRIRELHLGHLALG